MKKQVWQEDIGQKWGGINEHTRETRTGSIFFFFFTQEKWYSEVDHDGLKTKTQHSEVSEEGKLSHEVYGIRNRMDDGKKL